MHLFFLNAARGFIPAAVSAAMARLERAEKPGAYVYDDDDNGSWSLPSGTAPLPYTIHDGIAVLEVSGAVASCQIPAWYWFANLTYENITAGIEAAVNDGEVRGIMLLVNSPGGSVTGCAEAADLIDRFSQEKPIWAHCQQADSAAYWLASATSRITVDPTGEAGSIGVICTHMDFSKMLEEWGIKVTMLHAGKHKADGNPYEPLGKEAEKLILADMEYLRGVFVENVARMRGEEPDTIKATEAKTFIGENAVREGLADQTGFSHDVLAEFVQFARENDPQPAQRREDMAKATTTPKGPKAAQDDKPGKAAEDNKDDNKDPDDEEDEGASAEDEEKDEKAAKASAGRRKPAAETSGSVRSAERERLSAIMSAPEAKNRQKLALKLATSTGLPADEVIDCLKEAPEEQAAAPGNPLKTGMDNAAKPKVASVQTEANGNTLVENMKRRYPESK